MIKYALQCAEGHVFESWFQSAGAFEQLAIGGHLTCASCGTQEVRKTMMAPAVRKKETEAKGQLAADKAEVSVPKPPAVAADTSLRAGADAALQKMRAEVEKNATYVGGNFAKEARAMHAGDAPERAIYGEARPAEARALLSEGVPVVPLPFIPKSKTN